MNAPTMRQVDDGHKRALRALRRMRLTIPELLAEADALRKGYPTSSRGGGAGGDSDPVGAIASANVDGGETAARTKVLEAIATYDDAIATLIAADSAMQRALPQKPKKDPNLVDCANKHCDDFADQKNKGRCSPCAAYLRENNRDAPKEVVEARVYRRREQELRGYTTIVPSTKGFTDAVEREIGRRA